MVYFEKKSADEKLPKELPVLRHSLCSESLYLQTILPQIRRLPNWSSVIGSIEFASIVILYEYNIKHARIQKVSSEGVQI